MMEQPKNITELTDGRPILCGFVTKGSQREEYWFEESPENIAAFLMTKCADADETVVTDPLDNLVLSAYGYFLDCCPEDSLREKVLEHLLPMQKGEIKPYDIFCPTIEEIEAQHAEPHMCGFDD